MENKKAITTCRIVAFMGILIGLLMFVFGIIVCTDSEIYYYGVREIYDDSIKYGADYYTDSYKAMATSANNTYAIAQLMSSAVTGIGLAMIFGGLALMLGFTIKFASSYINVKKKKIIKYVLQEDERVERNNDAEILMEYLRKSSENTYSKNEE